ncbi:hypothetical protein ACFE04_025260 [Oxalis oulophora]
MAQKLIVFALCLMAIVSLVSAANEAVSPVADSGSDMVGNTDDSPVSKGEDEVVAAPVGSEEAANGPSSFSGTSTVPAPAPNAGNALQITTLAGVVAASVAGFFF